MDTQTILNYVVGFFGSATGATLLTVIVKAIINAITNKVNKKHSKLTEQDKQDIASIVTASVMSAIQGGVSVDMDAQIEKATAHRISAIEHSQNEIVGKINELTQCQHAELCAIGDFKTISPESRERIKEIIKGDIAPLEKVEEIVAPVIEIVQSKKEKKATVNY